MKHGKNVRQKAIMSLSIVLIVATVISVARILRIFFEFSDGDFFELLISVFEAVGLVFSLFVAIRQLGDSKEIARAQFLTELNKSFVENSEYAEMYNALQNCVDGNCPNGEQCKQAHKCLLAIPKGTVSNYLTFFETLGLLIEDNVLTLEVIDNLFAYRFFLAVHSQFVQESKIIPQPENFVNIFRLERKWIDYRMRIGKPPKEGTVYATRCLETLVDRETYASLVQEGKKK